MKGGKRMDIFINKIDKSKRKVFKLFIIINYHRVAMNDYAQLS